MPALSPCGRTCDGCWAALASARHGGALRLLPPAAQGGGLVVGGAPSVPSARPVGRAVGRPCPPPLLQRRVWCGACLPRAQAPGSWPWTARTYRAPRAPTPRLAAHPPSLLRCAGRAGRGGRRGGALSVRLRPAKVPFEQRGQDCARLSRRRAGCRGDSALGPVTPHRRMLQLQRAVRRGGSAPCRRRAAALRLPILRPGCLPPHPPPPSPPPPPSTHHMRAPPPTPTAPAPASACAGCGAQGHAHHHLL
jgi:hypothetical protein